MFNEMSALPKKFAKGAAIATVLALAGTSSAYALPQFTFNPAAAGLAGTQFTADDIILTDYSTVTLTPTATGATFTDNGVLPVGIFSTGGSFVTPSGLNTTYGLYFQFTGTGTQNTQTFTAATQGTFNTLNYQLFGFNITPGTPVTFNPSNTTPTGVTNPILLGTGSLINGAIGATPVSGVATPNANTLLAFTANNPGFFVAPSPFFNADFASFTNSPSEVTQGPTGFVITQGGGSANFLTVATSVPEPMSLALLGSGLLATTMLRRRKNG